MSEDPLEAIILQTINGAITTIPGYMAEIKENNETLKVENAEEFVYGIVMGMALGNERCNTKCPRKTSNKRRSNESEGYYL